MPDEYLNLNEYIPTKEEEIFNQGRKEERRSISKYILKELTKAGGRNEREKGYREGISYLYYILTGEMI